MKMMKKLLGMAFLLAVLVGCLIFHASAAGDNETELDMPSGSLVGYCGGEGDGTNLTWTLDGGGTLTISGSGTMKDYGNGTAPWYAIRSFIKQVVISEDMTTIGDFAFYNCGSLTYVTIPNRVTSIGGYAFAGCNNMLFAIIGSGVTEIRDCVFDYPSRLTAIYFAGNAPEGIYHASDSDDETVLDGCSYFNEDTTFYYIPGTTGWTDSKAYDANSGSWQGYKLAVWEGQAPVVASGYCGGEGDGTNLTWILDSEGTLTISGSGAMKIYSAGSAPWDSYESSIKNVIIGDSVTSIGEYAFFYYSELISVTIPDSVTTIGDSAFTGCAGLTSMEIPASVISLGDRVFANCNNLKSFGVATDNDFYCSENGVLFSKEKDTLIGYPAGKTETIYAIPDSVSIIGSYAFNGCSRLISVGIPDSVTRIGDYAFEECDGLTSVTFPDSVTSIGWYAFQRCSGLTSVYFEGDAPVVNSSATRLFSNAMLYYIPGTTGWTDSDAYIASTGTWNGCKLAVWEERGGYCGGAHGGTNLYWLIDSDGALTISGSGAMKDYGNGSAPWYANRSSIKEVIIGDDVTTIGTNAFSDCESLTSVTIGDSVTAIGNNAFYWCSSLPSVTIPDSVRSIGRHAFSYCLELSSVTLGGSVSTIGWYAFAYCINMTSVEIPSSVTSIGWYAFDCCKKLTSVSFAGNAPAVGDYAFKADTVNLYCNSGTTGWADSKVYDAVAGTWNGYRLKMVATVTITDTGNTLSLDGIVHINQYAAVTGDVTQEFIEANGGLLIWKSEPAEADIATADEVVEGLEYNSRYADYGQATNGIAAKEFADELYMAIYLECAEGVYAYGPVKEFSVQQYCEKVLEQNNNRELMDLAVAMLHYGTAAQTYFNYNTADMANANIAEQYPADEWDAGLLNALVPYTTELTSTGDVTSTGKTLALEGAVLVNYYFQKTDADIVSGELQIWKGVTELTEDNITDTKEMVFSPSYGGEWTAPSLDFVAKEYGSTAYARAVLTDAEGNKYTSDIVAFSPEEYARLVIEQNKNANLVNLSKHLVMYGERARAYFG